MCENEYVAHMLVKARIREAEARGALNAMLHQEVVAPQPAANGASPRERRPTRLETVRHAAAAWVAHLVLPKTWNRL
jgi:hypothetical protein